MEIFLESSRNKFARDEEASIGVELKADQKILPQYGKISSVLSLSEQYNTERDNCEKFRLIFTINPVCTNVLYNVKTEVVQNEGSDDCVLLNGTEIDKPSGAINTGNNNKVDIEQALSDTEYSNPECGGLVYHCGVDIFKNHRLRSDGFHFFKEPSGKTQTETNNAKKVYNTIESYLTDNDGKVIEEKIVLSANTNVSKTKLHAYTIDELETFQDAYLDGVREVDGWYGFYNVGDINIPNKEIDGEELNLNRVINNNNQCEFIDFYPDRSLFSFIPKVNKARKRLENNWDYCITYPAESDCDALSTWGVADGNGNLILTEVKSGRTDGGSYTVSFRSLIPHGLSVNDYIRLSISQTEDGDDMKAVRCRVVGLGDVNGSDMEHRFTIRYHDISSIIPIWKDNDGKEYVYVEKITSSGFKRSVNGTDCKYYARKLRKLGNFRSECNKIVGGKNIYGDKFAQVVFTDDIDLPFDTLRTNLGLPVSDVYLTVVKRAVGGYKFYNGSGNSEDVEFSHCFGRVTSGIKLPKYMDDYNIYKINNAGDSATTPAVIEDNIRVYDDSFYYDIVEFDQTTMSERQLEMVYHRFNTYQRECTDDICDFQKPILWQYIKTDDYTPNEDGDGLAGFEISADTVDVVGDDTGLTVNIMPEGYFYQHSFRIKVREMSEPMSARLELLGKGATIVNMNHELSGESGFTVYEFPYAFAATSSMGLITGDELCFVITDGTVFRVKFKYYSDGYIFIDLIDGNDGVTEGDYDYVFRIAEYCPEFAQYNPRTSRLIWREVIPYSQLDHDSELYDIPFSNGALYKHSNINFFLQRQDPYNEYGLRDRNLSLATFVPEWKERIDLSHAVFFYNNLGNICF